MILALFEKVISMSLDASYVIIGILLIRTLLKKAPKVFSYALWIVVFIRLICPFSFESVFSFYNYIPAETINEKIISTTTIKNLNNNAPIILNTNNSIVPIRNNNQIDISHKSIGIKDILSYAWILGSFILLFYNVLAYLKVKNKTRSSTIIAKNIYETDQIETAFVFGIVNPKIYIPIGINEEERSYILAHEKVHIKRRDYLIKYLFFFALIIHWFNPFVWLSFIFMTKDMEMSCDEAALKNLGENCTRNYSLTLLKFATRNTLNQSLLSFGENSTKSRIKNILKYKRPAIRVIVICSILCITVVVASTTNAVSESIINNTTSNNTVSDSINNTTSNNTVNATNSSINLTNTSSNKTDSTINNFNQSTINNFNVSTINNLNESIIKYLISKSTWLYYTDNGYRYINFNPNGAFEIGESNATYYKTGYYTVNNYDITVNITIRHSSYTESVNGTYKLYLNYKEESLSITMQDGVILDKPYVFKPRLSIDDISPTAFNDGANDLTLSYLMAPSWRFVDYNDHSKSLGGTLIFYGDDTCVINGGPIGRGVIDTIDYIFYKGKYTIDGNNVSIQINSSINDRDNYETITPENKTFELAFNSSDEILYVKYMVVDGVRTNNPFAFVDK